MDTQVSSGRQTQEVHPVLLSHIETFQPAAVLVPLYWRPTGLSLILTKRLFSLRTHPGQISFPGGKQDETDVSLAATALREAEEEIGIPATHATIIGELTPILTVSGYQVHPQIGLITKPFAIQPQTTEVAEVFELPLYYLLNPAHHTFEYIERKGMRVRVRVITYGSHYIWGATASMLHELASRLLAAKSLGDL
ncbi:CoA pyrophosphatase [Leeia oryzae]|uniref:CoA pyrophosphatase n=1 Tax=Leeia oryzae TaxID=356662 RepID=UPI0014614A64|nr:CoA pyrophosphatase [Leeia oryzae]